MFDIDIPWHSIYFRLYAIINADLNYLEMRRKPLSLTEVPSDANCMAVMREMYTQDANVTSISSRFVKFDLNKVGLDTPAIEYCYLIYMYIVLLFRFRNNGPTV